MAFSVGQSFCGACFGGACLGSCHAEKTLQGPAKGPHALSFFLQGFPARSLSLALPLPLQSVWDLLGASPWRASPKTGTLTRLFQEQDKVLGPRMVLFAVFGEHMFFGGLINFSCLPK